MTAIKKNKTDESIKQRSQRRLTSFTVSMQRAVNADGPMGDVLSIMTLYTALGQFLYRIGFQCEYFIICAGRTITFGFNRFLHYSLIILKALWKLIKKVFGFILHDFIEFFQKIGHAFINVRDIITNNGELGKAKSFSQAVKYLAAGVVKHRSVWLSLVSYVLPIAAVMVFVYTVDTMLNYQFALQVEYNGQSIGYIENELLFEEAQALVRERIRTTGNEETFAALPAFALSVTNEQLTTREDLADNIVKTSSDQIQEATGITVDGTLLGVTTDGAVLRATLDEMLNKYRDPNKPEVRVDFVNNVELIDGLYYTVSLTDTQSILNTLTGEVEGQRIYAVQKGDSPMVIAQKNDISLNELYALNPKMVEKGYKMPIGDELIISRQENFLKVKTIETIVYDEEIAFNVTQEKTDTLFEKQKKVTQAGQKGLDRITADHVKIDGVLVEAVELNRETIKEPVEQKELIGTKSLATAPASSVGTGSMQFPLASYKQITTRFMQGGHRGVDITAAAGTPVMACDSGTVVESGWHPSWGNYVKINHGNGFTTLYAHNSALYVSAGQVVARGSVIAAVGNTGNSSGNHLHLEMTIGGGLVNALSYVG